MGDEASRAPQTVSVIPAVSGQLVGFWLSVGCPRGCPWLGPRSSVEPAAAQEQREGDGIEQQLQQFQNRQDRGTKPQAPEAAHG